jgi:hypothetical protein
MRIPTKARTVSEVKPGDKRVKVFGTVVSVAAAEGKLVLDDGSATVELFLNNLDLIEKRDAYKPGDQIVAIGWAGASGIDAEIIRRINGFDPNRYKQVLEVWKNVRSENKQA